MPPTTRRPHPTQQPKIASHSASNNCWSTRSGRKPSKIQAPAAAPSRNCAMSPQMPRSAQPTATPTPGRQRVCASTCRTRARTTTAGRIGRIRRKQPEQCIAPPREGRGPGCPDPAQSGPCRQAQSARQSAAPADLHRSVWNRCIPSHHRADARVSRADHFRTVARVEVISLPLILKGKPLV